MIGCVLVLGVLGMLGMLGIGQVAGSTGGTIRGRVAVVKDGKVIAREDVWVYLEDLGRRRRRSADAPAPAMREIRQIKTQFSPHVLVVPVGTTVAFPNFDLEEHNVFSPTDPPGQFDLGRYNTDHKGKTHRFDDPAEMEIYCDIHKQMWARVKVVDSGYIVAVKQGQFTIEGVPPGTYKVHAWTRDSAEVLERVIVTEGQTSTVEELHLQLGKERTHTRLDGNSYGPYR